MTASEAKIKCVIVCLSMTMAAELAKGQPAERIYRRAYSDALAFLEARRFPLAMFTVWFTKMQSKIRKLRERRQAKKL
jgi:hypothetical protein